LGFDLTDIKTGIQVIPLWARYGSHRVLKIDDTLSTIAIFDRYVTPKPDYPEFVNYAMYGLPRLNRPTLNVGHISQICRARPGPASTFLYPPAGSILSPAQNARSMNVLAPWSVLFTNTHRLGGARLKKSSYVVKKEKKEKKNISKPPKITTSNQSLLPIDALFEKY
jgi:hypothetical protein